MNGKRYKLGELIEMCEEQNLECKYGLDSVRGMTLEKEIIPTKANLSGNDLSKFKIVRPGDFIYNPRTHGKRIGLGFNQSQETFLISWNNTAFRIKNTSVILSEYLLMYFLRDEWDREACYQSWGSSTEVFSWKSLCEMKIIVPSLEEQRKAVEVWQGLRKIKVENEQLAEPLMQLCRSYLQNCKRNYPMVEIGPMIKESTSRNTQNLAVDSVRGLSTNKAIIPTVANLEGVSLSNYKTVSPAQFAYVPDTSRRGDKVSYGFNESCDTVLVSSISTVFEVKDQSPLLPAFLNLWLCRPEFDRYARFNSWGSARETFSFADMCRVKIPLPPIDIQQAVVDVYRCANEAKRIAEAADRLSREICPALIQRTASPSLRTLQMRSPSQMRSLITGTTLTGTAHLQCAAREGA